MSEKYKARNPEGLYFITLTLTNWVDLFTRPVYKHIIIESLEFCQKHKGLLIYAYVLMTNHIHLIVRMSDSNNLSDVIRDFKSFTSKRLTEAIQQNPESRKMLLLGEFSSKAKELNRSKTYKVWQDGFHPIELTNNNMIDQKLDYIHNNPVVEEIVVNPENYKYSSAVNYAGGIGVLTISTL